jgi:putative N6-adenine-specific DNA methylase
MLNRESVVVAGSVPLAESSGAPQVVPQRRPWAYTNARVSCSTRCTTDSAANPPSAVISTFAPLNDPTSVLPSMVGPVVAHPAVNANTAHRIEPDRGVFIPSLSFGVKSSRRPNQVEAFAVTALGLEELCAAELGALGIRAKAVEGGAFWNGDFDSVMRANLWSRTASRVLIRVAEFRAKAFFELELNAKKIAWSRYVAPGASIEFRVTCRKSKLYHTGAIAQRLGDALMAAVGDVRVGKAAPTDDDVDADEPTIAQRQLFVVRFVHDVATVSVDTSGTLLHRRGYRQALAKAPLRETLAAATILGAGWDGSTSLSDPMCGSGTIPIEAAWVARRIAPGRDRSFAFCKWPEFRDDAWRTLVDDARSRELPRSPVAIDGSDRDAGAIEAARANAARAGVDADIAFEMRPVSALDARAGTGLVVANPPYGVRVGESAGLRDLYARFGDVLRARRSGWQLALLSADRQLERQLRLDLQERLVTRNGGIPVHLVVAPIP